MSCEREIAESFRRAHYKVTPQRLLIASVLRHSGRHLSASEIAEEVQRAFPTVDVSTVYRTMELLKKMRLATETDMATGESVFEWSGEEPHHHLICTECGYQQELQHRHFDSLAAIIEAEYEFAADFQHFAIFGTCRHCREAHAAAGPAG